MGKRKTRQSSELDIAEYSHMTHSTPVPARMSQQPIPAPSYDGTTDVEDFLMQFGAIAQHNGWSQDECKLRLSLSLKGSVSRGVNADTYKGMCRQLQQQYAPSNEMATALLKEVKKHASENIYQFAERVRKLVSKALPDLDKGQQQQQVKQELIASVPSGSQLAWTLRLAPPDTVEETVDVIHKFHEFSGSRIKVNRIETDELQDIRNELEKQAAAQRATQEEMFKQFATLQTTMMEQIVATQQKMAAAQQELLTHVVSSKSSGQRDNRCFNCNSRGHYARDCRKPRRATVAGNGDVQSS